MEYLFHDVSVCLALYEFHLFARLSVHGLLFLFNCLETFFAVYQIIVDVKMDGTFDCLRFARPVVISYF